MVLRIRTTTSRYWVWIQVVKHSRKYAYYYYYYYSRLLNNCRCIGLLLHLIPMA